MILEEKLKRLTVYEFLNQVHNEPYKWINYCEILILRSGLICICNPSHQEIAIRYMMEEEHLKTRDEAINSIPKSCLPLDWVIDKYNIISYWYEGYIHSSKGPNRFQRHTIKVLKENGLLSNNPFINKATEYTKYLYRKEMGWEE